MEKTTTQTIITRPRLDDPLVVKAGLITIPLLQISQGKPIHLLQNNFTCDMNYV